MRGPPAFSCDSHRESNRDSRSKKTQGVAPVVARAITGHVTERMTEHYSHVDVGEKKAAVEGMLKLVKGGKAESENETKKHQLAESRQAHFQAHAPQNRHIGAESAARAGETARLPGG